MINYIQACELSFNYFKNEMGKKGLRKVYEAEYFWIFYGGIEGEIGEVGISVRKSDGRLSDFILPSRENLAILNNSKELDIPDEFKITY